jgi:hypothetical protein
MRHWDRGLDYESTYEYLLRHLKKMLKLKKYTAVCYDAILLTQLRNGLRVSESVRAFKEFINTKSIEVTVTVSKKKRQRHD